jgi:hypothetical protein
MSPDKLHRYVSRIGPRELNRKEVRPEDGWTAAENESWPARRYLSPIAVKRKSTKALSDDDPAGRSLR